VPAKTSRPTIQSLAFAQQRPSAASNRQGRCKLYTTAVELSETELINALFKPNFC